MKKLVSLILSIVSVFTVFAFSACGDKDGEVKIKYFAEATDLVAALKSGQYSYGVLPEPAATNLEKLTKDEKTWYRLDIQELYDSEVKAYPQAVMLVKESVLNSMPGLVNSIADKFGANVTWVVENPAEAVNAVNSALPDGVTPSLKPAALTEQAVKNCNIKWQSAENSKTAVKDYLNSIIALNETAAKAAADDFFYAGTASGTFTSDTVKVYAPDGAPALAIAKFIKDGETFGTDKTFNYNVVASDKIGAQVQKGTGDIVILPVNAASKLYKANASDPYKLVSVVTHGNLYIMCSENVAEKDLKNKTVGLFGQGLVPDLTFKIVLDKLGLKAGIAD